MSGGFVVCPPTPPKYMHDNHTLWAGCGGVAVWFNEEIDELTALLNPKA